MNHDATLDGGVGVECPKTRTKLCWKQLLCKHQIQFLPHNWIHEKFFIILWNFMFTKFHWSGAMPAVNFWCYSLTAARKPALFCGSNRTEKRMSINVIFSPLKLTQLSSLYRKVFYSTAEIISSVIAIIIFTTAGRNFGFFPGWIETLIFAR